MRRTLPLFLFCLLLAVPGLAGQPEIALQRAADHYRAGKLNEAAGLLRGFLVSQPDPSQHNSAYFMLARIHADLGEPAQSLQYLEQIPAAERGPAMRLLEGRMLARSGQPVRADQVLSALDPSDLTPEERQMRWLFLSEATLLIEEPQRALYYLYRTLTTPGSKNPDDIQARIHSVMDSRFNESELREASFMYAGTPLAYQAMLKLGWLALGNQDKEQARQWAAAVLDAPPGFAYRSEALSLLSQVNDPSQIQRAIGVLLPLSGRYAPFGTLVQRGMQLAETDFRPDVPVRLIYRDTAGDPGQAEQQLAELAISERVIAVVGPLVGSAAEAVLDLTTQQRLPLLSLSQKEGLAAASPYVFRNALTTRLQVQTLVETATNDLGLSRFAILAPTTRQGELFAEQFRHELERSGCELVAVQAYSPEQTDFRREVRLLLGKDPDAPDEEEPAAVPLSGPSPPEEEMAPFEALFIPDYADRISLIAPQLAFYGLEQVQLLGTNGWNDPELLRTTGNYLEGAIFTDGFFRHSPYPFVREFVQRYYASHGQDPTILEAQGYDAAGILLTLLESPDIQNREHLRQALTEIQNYPGVAGATRFDAEGEADKVLFLLQFRDGTIVQRN